jgi:hypothetical protein
MRLGAAAAISLIPLRLMSASVRKALLTTYERTEPSRTPLGNDPVVVIAAIPVLL